MNIFDITVEINESMTVYKNREAKMVRYSNMANHPENGAHETLISLPSQTGTHIDLPLHMIADGATSESYHPKTMFMKRAVVIDFSDHQGGISADDLKPYFATTDDAVTQMVSGELTQSGGALVGPGDFVILKTPSSATDEFLFDFVYVDESAAQYLVEQQVAGVGIDALGIEREQPDHETHVELLSHGVTILEGVRLEAVKPGEYTLCALPLSMGQLDGMPVRVLLIDDIGLISTFADKSITWH